jgi:hypothetical protein
VIAGGRRPLGLAGAAGGVAVLAFALGWWSGDDGSRRVLPASAAVGWTAPKSTVSDISGYAKIVTQRPPFGAPAERGNAAGTAAPAAPGNAAAAQWRVGGIVVTETNRHLVVLIRRPGDNALRSEIRHPGDELPDGSILRTVEPTNVTIERQGTIVGIKMFAQN